eukprot:4628708-Prorocentrum_lima.AAC.1
MTSSLVGSEMCIRDRSVPVSVSVPVSLSVPAPVSAPVPVSVPVSVSSACLLYTSDAADDM